ncbi:hypothetical protein GB937_006379 [Aspergillus fischeri]|nr:hypothetical protein GB937_006379 [Aspergillus fischeri]
MLRVLEVRCVFEVLLRGVLPDPLSDTGDKTVLDNTLLPAETKRHNSIPTGDNTNSDCSPGNSSTATEQHAPYFPERSPGNSGRREESNIRDFKRRIARLSEHRMEDDRHIGDGLKDYNGRVRACTVDGRLSNKAAATTDDRAEVTDSFVSLHSLTKALEALGERYKDAQRDLHGMWMKRRENRRVLIWQDYVLSLVVRQSRGRRSLQSVTERIVESETRDPIANGMVVDEGGRELVSPLGL